MFLISQLNPDQSTADSDFDRMHNQSYPISLATILLITSQLPLLLPQPRPRPWLRLRLRLLNTRCAARGGCCRLALVLASQTDG